MGYITYQRNIANNKQTYMIIQAAWLKVATCIIFPWKGVCPSIWRYLNPVHPRMICAKFSWNSGPMALHGEEKFYKFCQCNSTIIFKKGVTLVLNAFESPSPKDALCQAWLKLTQWFWRKRQKCVKFTMTTRMIMDKFLIRVCCSLWLWFQSRFSICFII